MTVKRYRLTNGLLNSPEIEAHHVFDGNKDVVLATDYDALRDDLRARPSIEDYAQKCVRIRELEAELTLLSDKACTAVVGYRAALGTLTDSFKYPAEVVRIARNALASTANREAEHE